MPDIHTGLRGHFKWTVELPLSYQWLNPEKHGTVLGTGHQQEHCPALHAGKLYEEGKTQKTWKPLVEKQRRVPLPTPKNKSNKC